MGRSVDDRVVQMKFDNASFERNARQSMSTIDALKQKLDFSGSAKGLSALQKSANSFNMSGVGSAIETVQARFSALQIVGMTVISKLTDSALDMLKRITQNTIGLIKTGGINRAMNIESAKFSLQGLGIAWKDAYESIDFGVTNTAYGLDSAARAAAQLAASGVSVYDKIAATSIDMANGNKKVTKTTTSMGKSLKAISAVAAQTNSDFDSIASIFTTVAGQGKVMTEQMNQLAYRGMNAFTVVGERLGKSEKEVRDMVSKGTIDYNTFMDAMYYKFAENAGKANETLTGVTSNIKAALSKIGALFFSPIVENGGALVTMLDAIRAKLNEFKTVLDKSGLDDLFAAFQSNFFTRIADQIKAIDIESFTSAFVHFAKGIVNIFKPIVGIFKAIGGAFSEVFGGKSMQDVDSSAERFEELTSKLVLAQRASERIQAVFRNFFTIIKNAKNIFAQMFPVDTTAVINHIVTAFNKFASSLTYNHKAVMNFAKLSRGLFSLLDTGYTIIKTIITSLFPNLDKFFGSTLSSAGDKLIDFAGALGDALLKFNAFVHSVVDSDHPVRKIMDSFGTIFATLRGVLADIFKIGSSVFGDLFKSLISLLEPITRILTKFVDVIKNVLDSIANGEKIDWKKAFAAAGLTVTLTYFWKRITWFLGQFDRFRKNLVEFAQTGFGAIANTFSKLKDKADDIASIPSKIGKALTSFANEKNATAILKLAAAVGILALSLVALSTIEPEKLSRSLAAVLTLVGGLAIAAVAVINSLSSFGSITKEIGNWKDIFENAFNSLNIFLKLQGLGDVLIKLAAGVAILAVSVLVLSRLDLKSLMKGLAGVAALLTGMVIAINSISAELNPMQLSSISSVLISLSLAITVLGFAVRSFAKMDDVALLQGLIGVFALLAGMAVFINYLPDGKKVLGISAGMLLMAVAIRVMASAVKALAKIDTLDLISGIGGLLAILFGVGVALTYMQANLAGAAALLVAAAAIAVFTVSVMALSKMEGVGKTLLVLAGGLLVLFAATALAGIVSPLVLAFSVALTALGAALIVAGAGMALFSAGFAAMELILIGGTGVIIAGITALVGGLVKASVGVGIAVANALASFLTAMAHKLPAMVKFFSAAITALLNALSEAIPRIAAAGVNLILSLLGGIASNIGQIGSVVADLIARFLGSIGTNIPIIIQAGVDLMLNFINGLANGIRDNTDKVISAMGNLISAVIESALSLLQYLVEDIPLIGDDMAAGLESAKDKVRDVLAYDSMSSIGEDAISGVTDSIKENADGASEAGAAVGESVKTGMEESISDLDFGDVGSGIGEQLMGGFDEIDMGSIGSQLGLDFSNGLAETDVASVGTQLGLGGSDAASATSPQYTTAGKNAGAGFVSGIRSYYSTAGAVGGTLGTTSLAGLKSALGIHSPSREYGEAARFSVLGYVNFMKKYAYMAADAAAELGKDSIESLYNTCAKVADAMNTKESLVITPVLDMNAMESQLNSLDSSMGNRTMSLARTMNVTNQNGMVQQINELTEAVNRLNDSQNSETMANIYGLMTSYFPEFTKDVVLDGRKVSKGTATYINDDINAINRFNNLLAGVK